MKTQPVPITCGVAGFVTPYVIHKDNIGENDTVEDLLLKAKKYATFKNLILNVGLDNWFVQLTTNAIMGYCAVGTGSSPPNVTQTGLDNFLTETTVSATSSGNAGAPDWYSYFRKTYTFPLGGVVGNLSEIAVKAATIYTTRALIKDSGGDPTTITVGADEQLIVVYELRKYPPLADVVGTLTIDVNDVPTDYDVVIRAANVATVGSCIHGPNTTLSSASSGGTGSRAFESQTLAAIDGNIAGANSSGGLTQSAYVPGSFYRDYVAEFSLSQGNFATGIGGLSFFSFDHSADGFQVSVNPKIPKNSDRLLSIPVRLSWARI